MNGIDVKPICFSYPMLDFTDESGMGEVIACLLAWMASQERMMLQRRIKAGMDKAKITGTRSGAPIGRPKISASKQSRIRSMRAAGSRYGAICARLKVSKSVAFKYAKEA